MTNQIDPQLQQIIAAARSHRSDPTAASAAELERLGLQPLTGGRNNPAFAFDHQGATLCLKLHAVDHRRRAEREWTALQFLQQQRPGLAPTPLHYAADQIQPAIVMSFVPGAPLNHRQLDPIELDALFATLQQIYTITLDRASYAWSVVGTIASVTERTVGWAERTTDRSDPLIRSCCDLMERWHTSSDPLLLMQPAPLVFGRGDPSLANCLFDGGILRCIDWEYSGWSDVAFEIADLIEGPWSRQTPDHTWLQFADRFDLIEGPLAARFAAASRMLACFWLYKLGEQYKQQVIDAPVLIDQIGRGEKMISDNE